jgi:iron complex outermembrane receptor protein
MNKGLILRALILLICTSINAQKDTIKLKEVSITSNRIVLPFSKSSRTITILSSEDILKSSSNNLTDLLQSVAGIDIRRRGTDGMQSDLYIRGGNFDQTLVLIDGVKMDDVQTGHHTMNAILPLYIIERIEIIKGPAARIYGQNAFTGAINIVTKEVLDNSLDIYLNYGAYNNKKGATSIGKKFQEGSFLASVSYQESDGYRFNTDFSTTSAFLKSNYNNYTLISSFTQRKFGANGFYASPAYVDQYEEIQTSLISLSASFVSENIAIKPRLYWRRNQDMYLFLRHDPSFFRNLHISNKVGAETSVEFDSGLGKTGVGLDISRTFLSSNNLNNHNRTAVTGFLEHRFELLNENLDITPGVAISYYSDFDAKAFPGIDVGYRVSDAFKFYGNIGYTYRIPTFTDLYYVGPTTLGNSELVPESALSEEFGLKYSDQIFQFDISLFNRKSDNLIDWTKDAEEDKWQTRNFSEVVTQGIEAVIDYKFRMSSYHQNLKLGYSFINDDIKDNNVQFTRYSLNSIKHQMTSSFESRFYSFLSQNISYKYIERTDGESYNVVDAKITMSLNKGIDIFLSANNIFNATYTETNLVPMPKGNLMFGIKYKAY